MYLLFYLYRYVTRDHKTDRKYRNKTTKQTWSRRHQGISWAEILDTEVKDTLLILNKKLQAMDTTMQGPQDSFDDALLNKIWLLEQTINTIAQQNNQEYSYVLSLYNILKEYGNTVDLTKINTMWIASLRSHTTWEKYGEHIDSQNNNTLISILQWDTPILLSRTAHSVLQSDTIWNTYTENDKFYSLVSTIPITISDDTFQRKEITTEIDITGITDPNEITTAILYKLSRLQSQWTWVAGTVVSHIESSQKNNNMKEQSAFLSTSSNYNHNIISNLKTTNNNGKITLQAILYIPKETNG